MILCDISFGPPINTTRLRDRKGVKSRLQLTVERSRHKLHTLHPQRIGQRSGQGSFHGVRADVRREVETEHLANGADT